MVKISLKGPNQQPGSGKDNLSRRTHECCLFGTVKYGEKRPPILQKCDFLGKNRPYFSKSRTCELPKNRPFLSEIQNEDAYRGMYSEECDQLVNN